MEPRYRLRIYLLTALVLAGCGVLLARLYEFQIEKRDDFRKLVPGNRTVTVREPGIRGVIKDRNGIELARNQRKYEITFNLAEIHQAYRLQAEKDLKRETVVSEKGMPRKKLETDIVKIVNQRIIPALDKLGLAVNYNATHLRVHYITHGGLVPFSYRTDVDYDQFARFAEHSLELPGVYLNLKPRREYPYQALCGHMLGFVRPWDPKDIPEEDVRKFNHYIGDERGVAGLERTLNDYLRGRPGEKRILKNDKGRVLGLLPDYTMPGAGSEVTLTIDAPVQYLVSNVLRRAGTAAAVVMDVRTGEILAMASVPDYDPNDFIPPISAERQKQYDENPYNPLLNISICAFLPGSTFKIPTALTGALHGFANRTYVCTGGVNYNRRVQCWIERQSGGRHGPLDLSKATQHSCNPYFMLMGNNIGAKGMLDGFNMLGFGQKTGIPLPGEEPGIVIGDRTWQELPQRVGKRPAPVDIGYLSIGQAESMATPLQLCAVTACVANGGRYYEPRLVKKIVTGNGETLEYPPKVKVDLLKEGVKPADIERIRKGMWMAVNQGGTAGRTKLPNHEVAAKTGTAQLGTVIKNGKQYSRNNAWTVAFAPYDEPRYAVCVLVREGKSGGKVATPLVNLILSGLFARDEGKRLPLHPLDIAPGSLDPIEEIELPKDILATLDLTDEPEETGDEAAEALEASGITPVEPTDTQLLIITPKPVLTPEIDEEGTVVPRARAVEE